jgi:hypothetical protein
MADGRRQGDPDEHHRRRGHAGSGSGDHRLLGGQGMPENFSLRGLDLAQVVIGMRFIEIRATLLRSLFVLSLRPAEWVIRRAGAGAWPIAAWPIHADLGHLTQVHAHADGDYPYRPDPLATPRRRPLALIGRAAALLALRSSAELGDSARSGQMRPSSVVAIWPISGYLGKQPSVARAAIRRVGRTVPCTFLRVPSSQLRLAFR